MHLSRLKFAPIVVGLALGFAACGDDSNSKPDAVDTSVDAGGGREYDYGSPTTEGSETTAAETTVAAAGGEAYVKLADTAIGQILVDFDGNTLYLFASDPPDTVTCVSGCAAAWPPVFAPADFLVGDGLDADLFTVVDGENGPQLSYNGHPLYYFDGDTAAGDMNGQGSGDVWFVVDASGNPII